MAFTTVKTITIDHTKVAADQTDFPILIKGTYSFLKTVGNGGDVTSASGFDVVFSSDASGSPLLPWEIVNWDGATGEVEYWVTLPTISASVDDILYLCAGDASITTDQSNPIDTWVNQFRLVHHYPDGSSLTTDDSTGNGNTGSIVGTVTATAGEIDGAAEFGSAADGLIQVPANTTIDNLAMGSVTISYWLNVHGASGGQAVALNKSDGDVQSGWILWQTFQNIKFDVVRAVANSEWGDVFPYPSAFNTWTYITLTFDGTQTALGALLYVDGVNIPWSSTFSMGSGASPSDDTEPLQIGASSAKGVFHGGADSRLNGAMDEVRIAGVVRSPEWIETEFNSQSSPDTFYSVADIPSGFCQIVVSGSNIPCENVIPRPSTDVRFKLIKVMATLKPATHLPVRGSVT